jgi:hypothetical protein
MLKKKRFRSMWKYTAIIYMLLFISSCKTDSNKPDVSAIPVTVKIDRFEKDLFALDPADLPTGISRLKNKYGDFLNLFLYQVTAIGSRDSALLYDHLNGFLSDTNFLAISRDCDKMYPSLNDKEEEFTKAFRYYKYYFPQKNIPRVISMISGFSYAVVNDSTNLAVSLDMYLGPDYKYYATIDPALPSFMRNRMQSAYMVNDAMKGWALSDYGIDETSANMVDFIVSQGRTIYFLDKILPDEPDTIKTGYTAKQIEWCIANEKKIWSFFIDNKLLFSADPNLMNKYVNDGPTTNGFPKESPGNIGQFIGWQIVKSYMKSHPEISLQKLMEQKDMMVIFNEAKYKPAR